MTWAVRIGITRDALVDAGDCTSPIAPVENAATVPTEIVCRRLQRIYRHLVHELPVDMAIRQEQMRLVIPRDGFLFNPDDFRLSVSARHDLEGVVGLLSELPTWFRLAAAMPLNESFPTMENAEAQVQKIMEKHDIPPERGTVIVTSVAPWRRVTGRSPAMNESEAAAFFADAEPGEAGR